MAIHKTETAIIGGGIAGLWLLNLLRERGGDAMLIEKQALGCGQTLASQGMIHGGVKYALGGALTGASETIAGMPARWRACLAGSAAPDLRGVKVLADACYLFSDSRLTSRATAFLAGKSIAGRVSKVARRDYPPAFRTPAFKGLLYRLGDPVLDTRSLLARLAGGHSIVRGDPRIHQSAGRIDHIELDGCRIRADRYVLAAGKGNGGFLDELNIGVTMQLRPLHQVIIRGPRLPALYAHAITLKSADKPRITITTHPPGNGGRVWYLGGQLAETGIGRSGPEQIAFAREELNGLLPWLDFDGCEFSTLRIDRAEAARQRAMRPERPFVRQVNNVIVCWPTKLTLAPMLGDMFLQLPGNPAAASMVAAPSVPAADAPPIAAAPWE